MTKTPAKNDAGPIRMSLSSRFENLELAQHLCGKLLEGREVPEETRHWLLMALREALANAIKHGNRQDVSKRIHLEMDVVDENLQITIRDEGEGFEVNDVVDPTQGDALMRPGGRGVYLMRNIMDSVDFKENGLLVELEKKNANGANGVKGHEPA